MITIDDYLGRILKSGKLVVRQIQYTQAIKASKIP